jgi:hypothetical protein
MRGRSCAYSLDQWEDKGVADPNPSPAWGHARHRGFRRQPRHSARRAHHHLDPSGLPSIPSWYFATKISARTNSRLLAAPLASLASTHWLSIDMPTMRTSPGSPTSMPTARSTGSASNEPPTGTPIRPSRMNCRCSRSCMPRRFRPRRAAHSSPTCGRPIRVCQSRVSVSSRR